jgi:predicted Zn-dependent protease
VTLQRQETLEGSGSNTLPEWFSTHPSPVDREAAVRAQTADWRGKLPGQTFRVNRDAYLDRIDGLVYGDDPRRGFREGEWFYHPGEAFQFRVPAQWQFKREGEQIQMSHPQELVIVLFLPANGTVDQVARDFVAQLKAQVLQSASQTLNGFKVLRLVSTVVDGQQKARMVSYFFQKGSKVFSFHGLAEEANYAKVQNLLEQPAQSFAGLTDPARLNRQPQRLTVKKLSKPMTLQEVLQEGKIDGKLWPRIAWLNELQLNDRLTAGQRVKLVK